MLYVSLFCRIQSHAASTSLTLPLPASSRTSSETIFARGSAPVYPSCSPTARPGDERAVPEAVAAVWFAARGREVDLPEEPRCRSRSRLWTPESTIAIVGNDVSLGADPHCGTDRRRARSAGCCTPVAWTSASSVTPTTHSSEARSSIWSPVTSAVTVPSDLNFFVRPFALPGFFFCAARHWSGRPRLGSAVWMMTEKIASGLLLGLVLEHLRDERLRLRRRTGRRRRARGDRDARRRQSRAAANSAAGPCPRARSNAYQGPSCRRHSIRRCRFAAALCVSLFSAHRARAAFASDSRQARCESRPPERGI